MPLTSESSLLTAPVTPVPARLHCESVSKERLNAASSYTQRKLRDVQSVCVKSVVSLLPESESFPARREGPPRKVTVALLN